MERIGISDGVSNDYMDKVREVYHKSDDRSREAMVRSYYASEGTVISAKWVKHCPNSDFYHFIYFISIILTPHSFLTPSMK